MTRQVHSDRQVRGQTGKSISRSGSDQQGPRSGVVMMELQTDSPTPWAVTEGLCQTFKRSSWVMVVGGGPSEAGQGH